MDNNNVVIIICLFVLCLCMSVGLYFYLESSTPTTTTPPTTRATTKPATTPVATTPVATTPAATTPVATTPAVTTPAATTPVATTPVATTPVARNYLLISNMDYPYNDIKYYQGPYKDCAPLCDSTANCVAYTLQKETGQNCWLKTALQNAGPNNNRDTYYTGIKPPIYASYFSNIQIINNQDHTTKSVNLLNIDNDYLLSRINYTINTSDQGWGGMDSYVNLVIQRLVNNQLTTIWNSGNLMCVNDQSRNKKYDMIQEINSLPLQKNDQLNLLLTAPYGADIAIVNSISVDLR